MKIHRLMVGTLAVITACNVFASDVPEGGEHRPKLILAIAIDQFRYDYTTRFRVRYTSGLATMLSLHLFSTSLSMCMRNHLHTPTNRRSKQSPSPANGALLVAPIHL